MTKVHDYLAALDTTGDTFPEDFSAGITGAYDEDVSVYAAKINQLEALNAELTATVDTLKAHNYDLLIAGTNADADADEVEENEETDSEGDADGIDSLFVDADKEDDK